MSMSTKILFFIQFIFPIFLNSLANEQKSQRFRFYYFDRNFSDHYKIKRININNFDLSVELECSLPEIDCSDLYIKLKRQINFVDTNDHSFAEKLNNGLTKIHFKTESNKFREGIMIGLRRARRNIMQIEPFFHKNINFEPEEEEEENKEFRLTKFEWNLNFEKDYDSHINICFKAKNKGEYFIYVILYSPTIIKFFVKIEGEKEKCVFGKFKINSENLKNFFEELKEFVYVFAFKTNDETNFEDGQMIIELTDSDQIFFNGTNLLSLGPLFDDGSYEIYFDKNGKINDFLLSNRMLLKNSKNILKDYLIKRELGDKRNVFNKDEQIWFRYMKDDIQKNFKNENGKSKLIEVYKF